MLGSSPSTSIDAPASVTWWLANAAILLRAAECWSSTSAGLMSVTTSAIDCRGRSKSELLALSATDAAEIAIDPDGAGGFGGVVGVVGVLGEGGGLVVVDGLVGDPPPPPPPQPAALNMAITVYVIAAALRFFNCFIPLEIASLTTDDRAFECLFTHQSSALALYHVRGPINRGRERKDDRVMSRAFRFAQGTLRSAWFHPSQ